MIEIFQHILPIFLNIFLGAVVKRNWLKSEEFWRNLEKLFFFILLPAGIFHYVFNATLNFLDQIKLILILITTSVIIILFLLLYKKYYKVSAAEFTSIFQGSIRFNNVIFVSFGGSLLSEASMSILAIIATYMIIFTNVASVVMFNIYVPSQDKNTSKYGIYYKPITKILYNPIIIATVVACIFNYLDIKIYTYFSKFLYNLGHSAFTLGVIIIGASLKFTIKKRHISHVVVATVSKLLVFPIITLILLKIFNISSAEKEVALMYSTMPCALSAYVLSKQSGGDHESMAAIVTTSTIFSLFSLWLVMYSL